MKGGLPFSVVWSIAPTADAKKTRQAMHHHVRFVWSRFFCDSFFWVSPSFYLAVSSACPQMLPVSHSPFFSGLNTSFKATFTMLCWLVSFFKSAKGSVSVRRVRNLLHLRPLTDANRSAHTRWRWTFRCLQI